MEFSLELLALLFCVGVIAGWVDSIAGGGGLITLPVLILAGLPPAAALATNKLQGSAGTLTASFYFVRKKVVNLADMKFAIAATLTGSMLGSWLLLRIDAQQLMVLLPVMLVLMGLYFLFSPNISDIEKKQKLSVIGFSLLITPVLGFYDGFLALAPAA